MHATFIDALQSARAKRNMSGMPMAPAETRDIAAGFAEGASDRLRADTVANQNQQQIDMSQQHNNRMYGIAKSRMEQDNETNWQDYALPLAGAFAGSEVGSEMIGGAIDYAVKGATSVVSSIAKATWICTEVKDKNGMSDLLWDGLKPFRAYCKKEHPIWFYYYLAIGPALIEAINNDPDRNKTYADLKRELIAPVVMNTRCGKPECAFELYRDTVMSLIVAYRPDMLTTTTHIDNADTKAEPKLAAGKDGN